MTAVTKLQDHHFRVAAELLDCDIPAIRAVAAAEGKRAFLSDGRPIILFEPHVFRRLTGGIYDEIDADISHPIPLYKRGGYGTYSKQWERLETASRYDAASAVQAASWGAFQVLGSNWRDVGYSSPFAFRKAMERSISEHLLAFIRYVQARGLDAALREHRWDDFAKGYNGKDFRATGYHTKMAKFFAEYSAEGGEA